MSYNLRTGLMGSSELDINVNLQNLDASNITSGVFDRDPEDERSRHQGEDSHP